jgi:hypothetical protein
MPMTIKRHKAGRILGRLDANAMVAVERCLAVFPGIAKQGRAAIFPALAENRAPQGCSRPMRKVASSWSASAECRRPLPLVR